jgi:hypothetical protein
MPIKPTLLTIVSLALLGLAYRFGSHGIRLHDNLCIGLAGASVAVAGGLLVWAVRSGRRQRG